MKATVLETKFYEITDGEKWYTASLTEGGQYFVTNHKGRLINQGTAIHRKVVAAVNELLADLQSGGY